MKIIRVSDMICVNNEYFECANDRWPGILAWSSDLDDSCWIVDDYGLAVPGGCCFLGEFDPPYWDSDPTLQTVFNLSKALARRVMEKSYE
jgi:hypothetical protein